MTSNHSSYPLDLQMSKRFFWLFIVFHSLLWTLGPLLARHSLPHDTLEGITWGMQWQLGYNKHPFLTAWSLAGICKLLNAIEWPAYLLAQLAVATTFVSVWRLADKMIPPIHALIAALLLEGVLFYNINSFNLTPDTFQSPLWALLTLFLYQALNTQLIRYWLLTGVFAGLCILTKYQAALLFIPMLMLCLINVKARASFYKPGIYLAVGISILVITPHLLWLWKNDFITVQYALGTASDYTKNPSHFLQPLRFIIGSLPMVIGLFLLLWPFYRAPREQIQLTPFQWQFLLVIGLGPYLLTVVLCLISGDHYPLRWTTPYFFLSGIIAIAWLKPRLSTKRLKQFALGLIVFSSLLWLVRIGGLAFFPRANSDAYLPNKEIAKKLNSIWHTHYPAPLPYLAGSHYLVATVLPYMADKPIPFFSWDKKENPWLNDASLLKQGGLFIWDIEKNYIWDANSKALTTLPKEVKQRYPQLKEAVIYRFYRLNGKNSPLNIGVAILPPQ